MLELVMNAVKSSAVLVVLVLRRALSLYNLASLETIVPEASSIPVSPTVITTGVIFVATALTSSFVDATSVLNAVPML